MIHRSAVRRQARRILQLIDDGNCRAMLTVSRP